MTVDISTKKIRSIKRDIKWGGLIWVLVGIAYPARSWPRAEASWYGLGWALALCVVMVNCTEAILARIDEKFGPESPPSPGP